MVITGVSRKLRGEECIRGRPDGVQKSREQIHSPWGGSRRFIGPYPTSAPYETLQGRPPANFLEGARQVRQDEALHDVIVPYSAEKSTRTFTENTNYNIRYTLIVGSNPCEVAGWLVQESTGVRCYVRWHRQDACDLGILDPDLRQKKIPHRPGTTVGERREKRSLAGYFVSRMSRRRAVVVHVSRLSLSIPFVLAAAVLVIEGEGC